MPSLETTLKPLLPSGRSLSFPIKPEKEAEGLVVVATDDAMRKNLDETLRRGLVKSRYRLLVDASSHGLGVGEAKQQLQGTESKLPELSLYSGPTACPSFPEIITEMYLVTERPSTKAARELRRSLAVAGTPVMFDLAYHPDFRKRKGRSNGADGENNFSSALAGTLTMQLFELEMPDPFRQEMIKITAPMPKEWLALHPLPELEGWTEDAESFFS